jgi:hypothetical protein
MPGKARRALIGLQAPGDIEQQLLADAAPIGTAVPPSDPNP